MEVKRGLSVAVFLDVAVALEGGGKGRLLENN